MRGIASMILAAVLLTFFLVQGTMWGQSTYGTISGTIEDASRALIPGVTVTATNVNTGVVSTAITNETGAYNIPALLPGPYKVSAELPGFQTETKTGVELGNGQQLRLNFTLSIAGAQQAVEVSIPVDTLLATSSASVSGVLSEQRVRDLPVIANNAMDLVSNMPSIVSGFYGTSGQNRSEASYDTYIGGINAMGTVNITRDGINNAADAFLSGFQAATVLNADMVGELRVIVSPVDAELGRGNGQIQVLTRSGTNQFRGAAVWTIQNSAFNAKPWQQNTTGIPPSAAPGWYNTHQYTLNYGGPIKKNKTFFFVLWDQVLDWQRRNIVSPVLTPCARNGVFRFFDGVINGNAGIVSNPTQKPSVDIAGIPVEGLGPLRYASVFGRLPANLPAANADCSNIAALVTPGTAWDANRTGFDSTGYVKKLLSTDVMPLPNRYDLTGDGLNTAGFSWVTHVRGNGDLGGTSFQGTDQLNRRQINGKVDHSFTTRHKLSVGYTYEYTYSQGANSGTGLEPYPNSAPPTNAYRRPHVLTVNFTSTLSTNMVNEARMGLRRTANERSTQLTNSVQNFLINVNGYSMIPRLGSGTSFSGTSAMPFQNLVFYTLTPSRNASPYWTYGDTLSWAKGQHAFKFGGEFRRNSLTIWDNSIGSAANPTIIGRSESATDLLFAQAGGITSTTPFISGTTTNLAGTATTGNVLAMRQLLSFLAGSVANVTQNVYLNSPGDSKWQDINSSSNRVRTTRRDEISVFAKDDWKIRRDLTLNLGARWDYYGVPWEDHGMTVGLVGGASSAFGYSGRNFNDWMAPGQRGDLTSFQYIGPNSPNSSASLYPKRFHNFGPAVGFAWQPKWFGEGKTAVRGGYQITYALGTTAVPEPATTTYTGTLQDNAGRPAYLDLARLQASGSSLVPLSIPVGPDRPLQPVPVTARSQSLTVFDPNLVFPYTQNLTLSVTRTIRPNLTVDVRYLGTLARKQFMGLNLNTPNFRSNGLKDAFDIVRADGEATLLNNIFAGQTVSGRAFNGTNAGALIRTNPLFANNLANGNYVALASALNTLSTSACAANPSVAGQAGSVLRCNGYPENFIVANPQFGAVTYNTNLGYTNYHALQTQLNMRPTHGLAFQTTWTWSKSLGLQNCCTGPANGGNSGSFVGITDPLNRKLDYTLQGGDRRHIIQANGTYDLPIKLLLGKSSGPIARIVEGWKLGWIFNLVSGPPLDISSVNRLYANGVPDIVGSFPFSQKGVRWGLNAGTYTGGMYFPSDAFMIDKDPQCKNTAIVAASLAANCTLGAVFDAKTGQPLLVHPLPGNQGNLGRYPLTGIWQPQFDMNASKSFRIGETKNVQLRVDASNVFNHPVPNTPQLSLAPSPGTNALNTSFAQIVNSAGLGGTIGAKTGYRKIQAVLRINF